MSNELVQFGQILVHLLSSNNEQRNQAEKIFESTKQSNPEFFVSCLLHYLKGSQQEEIRALCAVLMRKTLGKGTTSVWERVPNIQNAIKTELMGLIEGEQKQHIRTKLVYVISEVGSMVLEKGSWPELLPFILKCTKSEVDGIRESGMDILGQLCEELYDSLKDHLKDLKEVLKAGLSDPKSLKVRISALLSTANFVQVFDKPQELQHFSELLPLMLGTISAALNANQEDEAREAIELFVDLAELSPGFLKPYINNIVPAMVTIATATNLEDATRQLGVEFLITFAENKPAWARKYPKFVETILPILVNMMLEVEETPEAEWNLGENEDEVDITNSDVAEEALDRISIALGGKSLVPMLFGAIPQLMQSTDWKHRHTALMAISIMGEGCNKYIKPHIAEVVKAILPFAKDAHPRVRWAFCNVCGQMSTDFGDVFQDKYHSVIIPALIEVMNDTQNPRVQSHAASAIINFCEYAVLESLTPYLDPLMTKFVELLQGNKKIVQEQVVTAVAAVADCITTGFLKYYDVFLPFLKNIVANAHGKEYRTLRGKAIECISLVGTAVGKEKFLADAKAVMELMHNTQSQLAADDPQVSFMLQSWTRICQCLGQDFVPYLELVMPPLLASAKISPDVTVVDSSAEKTAEGYDFISVGDKRIGINTSALEEKSTACSMLCCYAEQLKGGFFKYVDEVSKLMVPLVRFYYNDGVRNAALTILPHLLTSAQVYLKQNAVQGADASYVAALWKYMFDPLNDQMKEEVDMELVCVSLESLSECVKIIGQGCLTEEMMDKGIGTLLRLIKDVESRRNTRKNKQKDEDHDEEEQEKIDEEEERDEDIVAGSVEILGLFCKFNKELFLKKMKEFIVPLISHFIQPSNSAPNRQSALCLLDDIIEFTGAACLPFVAEFFPHCLNYVSDVDPTVRQAAVFGMGVIAQSGEHHVASSIPEILKRLVQVIASSDSKSEKYINSTENAIAAVGKICLYQANAVDVAQVIPMWLSWLPVISDAVESKVTYNLFCTMIENGNVHLLGHDFANLPKILTIFCEILTTKLIDEALTSRIVNIVQSFRTKFPTQLQNAYNTIAQLATRPRLAAILEQK